MTEPANLTATGAEVVPPAPAKDVVASLAGQIKHATSPGTYARLRRFDPTKHPQAAIFEVESLLAGAQVHLGGDNPAQRQDQHQRWALVLHCLAITNGAHDSRAEPGAALARLRFSEARLQQLVEARYPVLADLMPRVARRLAAAGVAVNWWPLVDLVLHTGTNDEPVAQQARRRLVSHYLQTQRQNSVDSASAAEAIDIV